MAEPTHDHYRENWQRFEDSISAAVIECMEAENPGMNVSQTMLLLAQVLCHLSGAQIAGLVSLNSLPPARRAEFMVLAARSFTKASMIEPRSGKDDPPSDFDFRTMMGGGR